MAEDPQGLDRLRSLARRLLWGALICLVLPALAWLGTALYETISPPGDGHVWGILAVALVLYVAPVGAVLLVLGIAAAGGAWWFGQRDGGGPVG